MRDHQGEERIGSGRRAVIGLALVFVSLATAASVTAAIVWTERSFPSVHRWTTIASSADGTRLAAGDYNAGESYIYLSNDSGATWTAVTSDPPGSRYWTSIASSSDGRYLAAATSGSYIYTSADYGATWTERATSRSWMQVVCSTDGKYLAAAATDASPGDYIYTSDDFGVTWTARPAAAQRQWYGLACSVDGAKLAAVATNYLDPTPPDSPSGTAGYVYTSTDYGLTWTKRAGSGLRSWNRIASSADGAKLVAVEDPFTVYTSPDSGATWTNQGSPGTGAANCYALASSADGTKLAAAEYNGNIYLSTTSGTVWTAVTGNPPGARGWYSIASSDNGAQLAAGVFDGYIYMGAQPSLVDLTFFTATPTDGAVLLTWRTGAEIDNLGFHLWRAHGDGQTYSRITSCLIPAKGEGPAGADYSFQDLDVIPGQNYLYQLEDIDLDGQSTFRGPVSATADRFGPKSHLEPKFDDSLMEDTNRPKVTGAQDDRTEKNRF